MIMRDNARQTRRTTLLFFGAIGIAVLVGLIFIYAASSVFAQERYADGAYYIKRQLFGVMLGVIMALIAYQMPLRILKKAAPLFFIGALLLTAATLIPGLGVKIHGSRRWLHVPGLMFQPSELLKYAAVLMIAAILSRYEGFMRFPLRRYGLMLIVIGATAGVLLLQPDFGMSVTIGLTGLLMIFVAYPDWRYVLMLGASTLPLIGLLIYKEPYRLKRLLVFLDPWADPQGAGFQIIQSLIAIGSGGVWGLGIGNSRQKFFYLPMQHTDFIFSIIAEEVGLVGSLLLVLLFASMTYYGMRLAWLMQDAFARYCILGFVLLTSLQAIINISVAIGMFPTKGIGLPFVSYGLSSLACAIAYTGIVLRAVREEATQ